MGGSIPGIPAIVIGRNPDLGWGLTASYLDDQDVYVEKLNPDDPKQYLTPQGWADFQTRDTEIDVRGAAPETLTLRWTRHGPVIPGDHFGMAAITPPGHVAALAWTALTAEDRSLGSAIALMRAHSVAEAREAIRDYVAPSLNVTLADHKSVALEMAGAAPKRQAGSTSQGRIPSPGWLAVNDWQGLRGFDENPFVVDPPSGIVVNTNNRITDAAFPDNLSFDWGDTYRILRAGRLLGDRQFHTLDSFVEIQTDTVSEAARVVLPLIGRDLWYSGEPAAADTRERMRQLALERLANWNGEMSEHTPEPLIYAAWLRALKRRLTQDELGPAIALLPGPEPLFIERVYRNVDGAAAWCDVRQTTAVETCAEMARLALDDALLELEETYGPRLESWRWGDAHQALHLHQTLGTIPVLKYLVNIRQSTSGGDHTLMRGQSTGRRARALPQRARLRLPRRLRLLRSRFERLRHRDRRERPPALAALRRPLGALAAGGLHPDVARPAARAGGRGRGDEAGAGPARRGRDPGAAGVRGQRMMRLYLAPARLASAMRPFWPKTTS